MKLITALFLLMLPSFLSAQKLKEMTIYYSKTKTIKSHYFVIKPQKEIKHGKYEVYYPNGRYKETGTFDKDIKLNFVKYNKNSQIIEELAYDTLTKNTYFNNRDLKSTEKYVNGLKEGTWSYFKQVPDKNTILDSSIYYEQNKIIWVEKWSLSDNNENVQKFNVIKSDRSVQDSTHSFIISHLTCDYPRAARMNQIEGTIYIQLTMNEHCEIKYQLLNSLGYGIEEEVEKMMDGFVLENQHNEVLPCEPFELTIPFQFVLSH